MALLEFECEACGRQFEELVRGGEAVTCPGCGAGEVRRLYSPVAPPRSPRLSKAAARDSDLRRSEREAARRERMSARRSGRDAD